MITRSKSRKAQTADTMTSNSNDSVQQLREEENTSSSEEINNQLGLPNMYEEITQADVEVEQRKQRRDAEAREEVQQTSSEAQNIGAWGQTSNNQDSGLDRIFFMLQQMQQNNETQSQAQNQALESIRAQTQKIEAQTQRIETSLRKEIREFREESLRMHQETRDELRKTERELRGEMQQMREESKAEVKAIKEDGEKTRQEMKENKEVVNNLKTEITKNRQQISQNTANLSENLNRINKELRSEIKSTKEEIGEQVKKQEEEKKRKMDEIKESQDLLTRRMNEVENRPGHRIAAVDHAKDIVFNGNDFYPMEFLQELKEIYQLYHTDDDVRWVGRHMADEAMTWWRIVKHDIKSFEDFEQQFINKYWNSYIQETVRDRLEYRRYRNQGNLTAVQYIQKHILQCRQLVPPITDSHLIKKLARHFSREIEVAVLVRSIKDFTQFEVLLQDYEKINNGVERQRFNHPQIKKETVSECEPPNSNKPKETWTKGKYTPATQKKGQRHVEVNAAIPTTSTYEKNS